MKDNTGAGAVTGFLQSMGCSKVLDKKKSKTRESRRKHKRQALRKRRVIETSIPAGKGFQ